MPVKLLCLVALFFCVITTIEAISSLELGKVSGRLIKFSVLLLATSIWLSIAIFTFPKSIETKAVKNIQTTGNIQFIEYDGKIINLNKEFGKIINKDSKIKIKEAKRYNFGILFPKTLTYEVMDGSQEETSKY